VIITVPQVQNYYELRFGQGDKDEDVIQHITNVANLVTATPAEGARKLGQVVLSVVLLPAAAVYPPLAGRQHLNYSPYFRYWAYEISAVVFFSLLVASEFPIFRAPRNWPRDYGLLVWTIMQFAHQVHFMFIDGVSSYFADLYEMVDLAANLCCLTAFILNLCNGHESIDVEGLLFSVAGTRYSCRDWPATVPLAGTDILAIGALLKGMLLFRLLRFHSKYGPLLLMVLRMAVDMLMWLLLSAVPIVAFSAAFSIIYKDQYDYDTAASHDDNCNFNPDKAFETISASVIILIDTMLSSDGQFNCFRESSSQVVAPGLMYIFILISCIMLINMLIAMMGKTFDNVFEMQGTLFLYLKARTMRSWLEYPAAPPPLNFLSFPYAMCVAFRQLRQCGLAIEMRDDLPKQKHLRKSKSWMRKGKCWSEEKAVQFPQSYLQQLAANNEERSPADGLRALIIEYMDENGDSVIREDRWKTELLRAVNQKAKADGMAMTAASIQAMVGEMAALRAVVERQATEMAELRAAIANIDLLLPEQECPNLPILPVAKSVRHATPKLSPDAGAAAVPPQQSHTCGPSAAGGVKLKFAGVLSRRWRDL